MNSLVGPPAAGVASWASNGPLAHLDPRGVKMVVDSGPAVAGAVGDGERLESTVAGAAVNLAARLEKHNRVLESRALATLQTHRAPLARSCAPTRRIEGP